MNEQNRKTYKYREYFFGLGWAMVRLGERHLILWRLMLGDHKETVRTSEWLCFQDPGDSRFL